GSAATFATAALSFFTMAGSSPAGPIRPATEPDTSDGKPSSAVEGTCGAVESRCGLATASARSLPDVTNGITWGVASNVMLTWPDTTLVTGSAPLLNGTCRNSTFATSWKMRIP